MRKMSRKNFLVHRVMLVECLLVITIMALLSASVMKSFQVLQDIFIRDSRALYAQTRAADLKNRWRHIFKDKSSADARQILDRAKIIEKKKRKLLAIANDRLSIPGNWRAEVKFEPHKTGADCAVLTLFKLKKSKRTATGPGYKMRIVAALKEPKP